MGDVVPCPSDDVGYLIDLESRRVVVGVTLSGDSENGGVVGSRLWLVLVADPSERVSS